MSFESLPQSQQKPEAKVIRGREAVHQKMVQESNKANQIFDRNMRNRVLRKLQSFPSSQDKTPEELEKMFVEEVESLSQRENMEVGNLELHMIGFPHQMEAIPVLRQRLETEIQSTDFTILEVGIQIADPKAARGQVARMSSTEIAFFQIEEMARKYKKKVILTDPGYNYDGSSREEYQEKLEEVDKKVQESIQTVIGIGGGIPAAAGATYGLLKTVDAIDKKTLTRRDALKIGGGVALTGLSFLATDKIGSAITAADEEHKALLLESGDRIKLYSFFDYRDVVIAEGIENLAGSFSKKIKATLLFGKGHIDGIKYYLENPKVRAMKLKAYEPYQAVARAELLVNEFIPDETVTEEKAQEHNFGEWKRTAQADILPKKKTPQ